LIFLHLPDDVMQAGRSFYKFSGDICGKKGYAEKKNAVIYLTLASTTTSLKMVLLPCLMGI
ncbi:hypothetical protein, partial [Tenacibaculum sediminilitoris]|uniref:hypothetical protein n=1 Tax=Tenacibaculum sediminilitoris TaxID=1820334 RepID=UPI0038B61593